MAAHKCPAQLLATARGGFEQPSKEPWEPKNGILERAAVLFALGEEEISLLDLAEGLINN